MKGASAFGAIALAAALTGCGANRTGVVLAPERAQSRLPRISVGDWQAAVTAFCEGHPSCVLSFGDDDSRGMRRTCDARSCRLSFPIPRRWSPFGAGGP